MIPKKVDIVYLWVDGSDKKWRTEKDKWFKKITGKHLVNKDAAADERFRDNGELLYSLRSVSEYAPWVNHIYIITGFGQVPKWLNTKHTKITIVPHEEIMPSDALPTFNSSAIEMCIPNIKNLSEHFLLMNDDIFFNKALSPSFFFDKYGCALVRFNVYTKHPKNIKQWLNISDTYTKTLIKSAKILDELFGKKLYFCKPSHGIDPYIKSSFIECKNVPKIKEQIDKLIRHKFRTDDEIQRWVFNLYDLMKKRAKFIHAHAIKYGRHKVLNTLYNMLHWKSTARSNLYISNVIGKRHELKRAATFCINDGPENDKNILLENRKFLESLFPNKCEFEK